MKPETAEKLAQAGMLLAGFGFIAMNLNLDSSHPSSVFIYFTLVEILVGIFMFACGAVKGGLK